MLSFCPKCVIHYNCLLSSERKPPEIEGLVIKVREASNYIAEQLKGGGGGG
jgi:hypothetical protein